jgi:rubredoxin
MKKWQCIVCGLIYNEADGWPDDGIAPGTLWQDVPGRLAVPGLRRRQNGFRDDRNQLID